MFLTLGWPHRRTLPHHGERVTVGHTMEAEIFFFIAFVIMVTSPDRSG
jgi:hypothetical protein